MKILVTGATGFLGKHLCADLKQSGHTVTELNSKNCDLRAADNLRRLKTGPLDQIYHLAAWTQAGDFCLTHKGEQWIINQQINTNVLTWWHEHQGQAKLVAMGSSCCYDPEFPCEEANFLEGKPIESLFTYGMTKRMLYNGMTSLQEQFGHRYICLVPSTLYGPDYHLDARQMHFIFDLMRKILRAKKHGEPVVLWGDGHQMREIMHVRDFVRAMTRLAATVDNDLVNVASGIEHTIREFAGMICQIVGYDPALIQYDTTRYVGARRKVLVTDKLFRLLPDFSTTPVRDGLREAVAWLDGAMERK